MILGPFAVEVTDPNPPDVVPALPGEKGCWRVGPKTFCGAAKMWRLNMLKKDAWKSSVAFSPISRVFFPMVKSSFLTAKDRAVDRDRGSSPKVQVVADVAQLVAGVNAAGFQNGVVVGSKFDLLVWGTPGTMLTRAPAPVTLQPPNKTLPAVPWQSP